MLDLSALMLGLGLGLRHATDADHVAVVSAMLQREPGALRAVRVAVFWGLGHTISFLALGLLVVLAGLHVPEAFERVAELLVAAMLVALGAWHWARGSNAAAPKRALSPARPLAVGLVHGLAGSAGVALLAATTIRSPLWAALYLVLFGVGTVLGMALLTAALSWPIGWTLRRQRPWSGWLVKVPAALSVVLGLFLGVEWLLDGREDRAWDAQKRGSDLIFIGRNLDRAALTRAFEQCAVQ
jgi:nickel/cobalt transporter (NicO) family protein